MNRKERLQRECEVFSRRGKKGYAPMSASTGYRQTKAGLLPSGFAIGANCVVRNLDELDEVFAARAAGANEEAIRHLVRTIEQRRRAGGQ